MGNMTGDLVMVSMLTEALLRWLQCRKQAEFSASAGTAYMEVEQC